MAQIFIDAATRQNPFESSIGYIIKEEDRILEFGRYLGEVDNHTAEWTCLIDALQQAAALNITTVIIKTDAKIIVDTIHKNYAKNVQYKQFLKQYQQLAEQFTLILIDWIPRNQNKHADHIARRYLK